MRLQLAIPPISIIDLDSSAARMVALDLDVFLTLPANAAISLITAFRISRV